MALAAAALAAERGVGRTSMRTEVTFLVGGKPERWWDGTSWFQFRERRFARDEVNAGEVEVLWFRAVRVWAMHSCERFAVLPEPVVDRSRRQVPGLAQLVGSVSCDRRSLPW